MSLRLDAIDLSAFRPATEADWREAAAKVLKGQPFDRLRTTTRDGVIEPIYARSTDARPMSSARGNAPLGFVARVDHPDAATANGLLLDDLAGGATGLDLLFATSPHAHGFGLVAGVDLKRVFEGVLADLVALRVSAGPATIARARNVLAATGLGAERLDLTLAHDPIAESVRSGGCDRPLADLIATTAGDAVALARAGLRGSLFTADGRIWHEAGASRTETLAALLATAVDYWRRLVAAGLDVEAAAERIGFVSAIDHGQFSGIAEVRALRLLWARATDAAGIGPRSAVIHAETSVRMMSRLDPDTNMIRNTVAAFAAAIGGVDSLAVLPHSIANGLPDARARRIARNVPLMLLAEANLHRVVDPGAGSGRVETETRMLAEAAWGLFQSIEAAGGIVAQVTAGALQSRIETTQADHARDVARRKEPITGASEFPLRVEPAAAIFDLAPDAPPAQAPAHAIAPLRLHRLSEPFEGLRAVAARMKPRVFLANLGTIAEFGGRSTWIRNLLEAGGIEVLTNDGFASLDDLVAAFTASGTRAVCLASSDAVYAVQALDALTALKAAGAEPVFFAGRPVAPLDEARLKDAGVEVFLFAGIDVVATLEAALARISA